MTPSQLSDQLRQEMVRQISIQHQLEAIFKLYDAAVMMNSTDLMEQYREQLHSLVDVKLDTTNAIAELTRQLIRSAE